PRVAVGVLLAPVVVLAAHPAVDRVLLAVDTHASGVDGVRRSDERLGLGERRAVHLRLEEQERRRGRGVAQRPPDAMTAARGLAVQRLTVEARRADARRQLALREGALADRVLLLDRRDATGLAVEPHGPQLAERVARPALG